MAGPQRHHALRVTCCFGRNRAECRVTPSGIPDERNSIPTPNGPDSLKL